MDNFRHIELWIGDRIDRTNKEIREISSKPPAAEKTLQESLLQAKLEAFALVRQKIAEIRRSRELHEPYEGQ